MNHFNVVLPHAISLTSLAVELVALTASEQQFYSEIYTDEALMRFINTDISKAKVDTDFKIILTELKKKFPKYISYVVSYKANKVGVFSIKLQRCDVIEIGLVLKQKQQGKGWSKKIKVGVINAISKQLEIKKVIAYCKYDNGAANHVNESLGFVLEKQFLHKTRNYLINKWGMDQLTIEGMKL